MIQLYYGQDSGYVQHKALKDLKKSLSDSAFTSLIKYDGYKDPIGEFLSDCLSLSLFGEKKTVVVLNCYFFLSTQGKKNPIPDSAQDYKGLRDYRKNPSPDTDLIRIVPGLVDKKGELYKTARNEGVELISCLSPTDSDLSIYVNQKASELKKKIQPDAVKLVIQYCQGDFLLLDNTLDKLFCYTDNVMAVDVKELVARPLENDVFSIVTSLLHGETGKALKVYHDLRKGGSNPLYLLPVFASQYRFMALVKALSLQHETKDSIARELSVKPGRIFYTLRDTESVSYDTLLKILSDRADREKERKLYRDDGDVKIEVFLATFSQKYRFA